MPRSKADDAARKRRERAANPATVRARSRARYHRNHDAILEQRRLDRQRNPERVRLEKRRHYLKHRERILKKSGGHYRANTEDVKARSRAYYAANRTLYRFADVRRKYGLSEADYVALEKHGNACAICKRPPGGKKGLCVDHDHKTGAVRGLLCDRCNSAIGMLGDSAARVQAAFDYLREHEAVQA